LEVRWRRRLEARLTLGVLEQAINTRQTKPGLVQPLRPGVQYTCQVDRL